EEIDPNGNKTRLLYDKLGRHYGRLDPLGYFLPPYEIDPNPPDPLAYQLPETPLEWEHGRLLSRRQIGRPDREDPVLRDFPAPVFNTFLEYTTHYDARPQDRGPNPLGSEGAAVEDELGRPVEQGPSGHAERWKYDPNGNLAEYRDR